MIEEIQLAAARLNRLVGNLLSMTRLESGQVKAKIDWCDLGEVIHVTLNELEKELAQHRVKADIAPNLPLVRLDFVLTQQAISNLLLNAAVHTPVGTEIRINAAAEGGSIILAVADSGPGLPSESVPHIFDKFYRAPSAPAGGTGLGLAIVKGFVEAQGGQVKAGNRPGGGAEFTVLLPLGTPPTVVMEMAHE